MLLVDRKPRDVHRAVSHGMLKLAVVDTRAVCENFYLVFVATRHLLFRTDTAHEAKQQGIHFNKSCRRNNETVNACWI